MPDFAEKVLAIIRATRAKSLPYWGVAEVTGRKSGSPADIVTRLDLEIEQYLAKEFAALDPGIGFVGEEFGGDRNAARHWLVDPIDGTAHFVRGLPFCTTMAALIEEGRVTFSAIYDFLNDRMYHAQAGHGAFLNGTPIRVSERPLDGAYLFYESDLSKNDNAATYLKLSRRVTVMNTLNAGYEFAMVASGRIEGRICLDPYGNDYDFAPGALLVQEAGGALTNIGRAGFDYRNLSFIAANRPVHAALTSGPEAIFPVR